MKVGDLVKWKNRHQHKHEWIGLIVKLEDPSFVHVLWQNSTEPWTWIHRDNVEVFDESR